jgi:hypothetical protein
MILSLSLHRGEGAPWKGRIAKELPNTPKKEEYRRAHGIDQPELPCIIGR